MGHLLGSAESVRNSSESLNDLGVSTMVSPPLDASDEFSLCLTEVMVVILNYRTPHLTVDCLKSLEPEAKNLPNLRVIVADNNSGDGSDVIIVEAIHQAGWTWAQFLPLEHNGGFAYGNNFPIRQAMNEGTLPPYVLLLNPDTVILPGAISALVQFMEQHPEVGIAGSRLQDPDGTPQCSAFRFHTVLSEIDGGLRLGIVHRLLAKRVVAPPISDVSCQTEWVAGASMMVRRQVFEDIGLMDEGYFMYYEEMDFCLQSNKAGWPCWYVPDSRVIHLVGQSSGVTNTKQPRKRQPQYVFDSRRRYFLKNYGWFYLLITDLLLILSFATWRVRRVLQQKSDLDPPALLLDIVRNSCFLRGFKLPDSPMELTTSTQGLGQASLDAQSPIRQNNRFFRESTIFVVALGIFAWLLFSSELHAFL
jgi:GT2 family glycosyltransferase